MKSVLFTLLILLSIPSIAQKKQQVIKMDDVEYASLEDMSFTCGEIIDKRIIKKNIGAVRVGLNNKVVPAVFPGDFTDAMKIILQRMLGSSEGKEELVFIIHEFAVSDEVGTWKVAGLFRLEMEIARRKDGKLYSLGSYSADVQKEAMAGIMKSHPERIISGIETCLLEFSKTDWQKMPEKEIVEGEESTCDLSSVPAKGLYASFSSLCRNKANQIEEDDYGLYVYEKRKYAQYVLRFQDESKNKERIHFISDGTELYIHASYYSYEKHYVKCKQLGRYVYFEDKFVDSSVVMTFGLLGAAASNTLKALILDTKTGFVYLLDQNSMELLCKDHPDLWKKYKSKMPNLKNKEKFIIELNELN